MTKKKTERVPIQKRARQLVRLVPPRRRLGERNELVMLSENLVAMLIFIALPLFPAKNNLVNLFAFRFGEKVPGTLTGEEPTALGFEEGVWKYYYSYTVDGQTFNGYSFSMKSVSERPDILVSRFNPALSKIDGATYAILGGVGFWVLVVPLFLFLWGLFAMIKGLIRTRGLLIRGEIVNAEIIPKTEEDTTEGENGLTRTYRVTLPDGGEDSFEADFPGKSFPRDLLLFRNPKTGDMRLPWRLSYLPEVTEDGQWKTPSTRRALRAAAWLAASLLLVAWALIRLSLEFSGG